MITIGRIVWVRDSSFAGEVPAIVVAVHSGDMVNVHAFANRPGGVMYLTGLKPQAGNEQSWGWRWPPRDPPNPPRNTDAAASSPAGV